MDIRDASKITILEQSDLGCTLLKTERGHVIVVTDDSNGIYIPDEITEKYKTRFFRLQVNQGGIVLTPAKMKLELVEEEETILGGPLEGNNLKIKEGSGSEGGEQKSAEALAQSGGS